jgi:Ca2+-binding RTX toxin-like protein
MALFLTKSASLAYKIQPLTFLIEGTDGNDTLNGTLYADTMYGRAGDDTLNGGFGNDLLYGGDGNDRLNGGSGSDLLEGGNGNDVLEGGNGSDTLVGGAGIDTVSYQGAGIGVMLDLANGGITNAASGDTYSGVENVHGSNFGDIIQGDAQSNEIRGLNGDDFLFGGAGNDRIDGGEGDDVVRGGIGNDILIAGAGDADRLTGDDAGFIGRDTFVLNGFGSNDPTIITDFQRGFDRLDLSGHLVDFGADGRLAIGSISHGFANLDSDDLFAFDVETHTLLRISTVVTGDGQEYTFFNPMAVLQGVDALSIADLIV